MGTLVRLLVLVLLLVFLLRLLVRGRPALPHARRRRAGARQPSTLMVQDPVCGRFVDPRQAIPGPAGAEGLYFCSVECRERHGGSRTPRSVGWTRDSG